MASLQPLYRRSSDLRHPIEDEFAQIAWGAGFGLRGDSVAAAPMYTLIDRTMVSAPGVARWEYRGKYLDGVSSDWVAESEAYWVVCVSRSRLGLGGLTQFCIFFLRHRTRDHSFPDQQKSSRNGSGSHFPGNTSRHKPPTALKLGSEDSEVSIRSPSLVPARVL